MGVGSTELITVAATALRLLDSHNGLHAVAAEVVAAAGACGKLCQDFGFLAVCDEPLAVSDAPRLLGVVEQKEHSNC